MTTTIVPSTGAGVLYTQQGVGTTPGYAALDDRRSTGGSLQEGVYGTSTLVTAGGVTNTPSADFMVTQRAAGANMSVDVNMPAGGFAYVQGDTINGQGLYTVPVHSANINETIAAADPTNPRVDQVILEIQDNVLDASGGNLARTRVLTGTPTGGANLTNRTGAVALPGNALLLADVLVGNAVASLANAVMRDRRKWARGAYFRYARSAGDYTVTGSSETEIDTTNIRQRIECSGAPLKVRLEAMGSGTNGAGTDIQIGAWLDGGLIVGGRRGVSNPGSGYSLNFDFEWDMVPAAGSHLVSLAWFTVAATTATLKGGTTNGLQYVIEEVVRSGAANNTVTTG